MSVEFTIRKATPNDYQRVCKLYCLVDSHHVALSPKIFRTTESAARPQAHYEDKIKDPKKVVFVAERADDLIGLIDAQQSAAPPYPMFAPLEFASIDNLVVLEEFRHKGVAYALLEAVRSWAKSKALTEIRLKVYSENQSAVEFYEKCGFSQFSAEYRELLKKAM